MKRKVLLLMLAGMFLVSSGWAMGRKPPMPPAEEKKTEVKQPVKTQEQPLARERTYNEGEKTYTVVSLKDWVKPEDILYNTEIEFKKEATPEQIEEIFKKYSVEIVSRNDKNKEYLVNLPDGKLSDRKKELRRESIVETVSVNPFAITDYDIWIMDKHIEVEFKSNISEKQKEEIINKYQTKISDIYENRYNLEILSNKRVPEVINIFRKDPNILFAKPVLMARFPESAKTNDNLFANQWYLEQTSDIDIDIAKAWGITVSNNIIRIAVIDSGVELSHTDLKETIITPDGCNLIKGEDSDTPEDKLGHGTEVCGIIGATTNNGRGISGICWNGNKMIVKIIPIKISNKEQFNTEELVEGIKYAIELKVDIINISVSAYSKDSLREAIQKAKEQGIIIVSAAGNDKIEIETEDDIKYRQAFPAGYEGVISVGSTNRIGVKSSFSNYGDAVSAFAPGEEIYTTGLNGTYGYEEGTSFAAPIVTGIVGLMKSEEPTLTNEKIKTILIETTKNNIVNAYNAIRRVQEQKGTFKGEMEVSKEEKLADRKMSTMGTQPEPTINESTGLTQLKIIWDNKYKQANNDIVDCIVDDDVLSGKIAIDSNTIENIYPKVVLVKDRINHYIKSAAFINKQGKIDKEFSTIGNKQSIKISKNNKYILLSKNIDSNIYEKTIINIDDLKVKKIINDYRANLISPNGEYLIGYIGSMAQGRVVIYNEKGIINEFETYMPRWDADISKKGDFIAITVITKDESGQRSGNLILLDEQGKELWKKENIIKTKNGDGTCVVKITNDNVIKVITIDEQKYYYFSKTGTLLEEGQGDGNMVRLLMDKMEDK